MGTAVWGLVNHLALFAQKGAAGAPGAGNAQPADGLSSLLGGPIPLLVLLFALFYFIILRPQRRDQARHQSMLNAIKKNDRVVTIGGIYGVVTNVHREADEVTIKVDETTNTKLRVTLRSIARVLGDGPSDENGTK
ncbi:MAG: preprotein translocase subunit YajC [Thermoguttaceae bacterium]